MFSIEQINRKKDILLYDTERWRGNTEVEGWENAKVGAQQQPALGKKS